MLKTIKLIVGFLLCSTFVFAQGDVSFEASTDAREVVQGNVLEVFFTLKNANGRDFKPPLFADFKVINGPNRSISNSIINGKVSSEMTFSYTLLAEKIGRFKIRSATIRAGSSQLSSRPIQVVVVKPKELNINAKGKGGGDKPIFLTAELSDTIAYVGQQVLIDYKIYTTVDVESFNLISESDYGGVLNQEIRRFSKQPVRVAIDGMQYVSQTLKRVAIFPQQAGDLRVDEFVVKLGTEDPNSNRRRRSFFFKNLKYQTKSAPAVTLRVRSLPGGAPDDFCGAVGNYTMSASVSPTNLTTDDAVTVKLYLRGNGDPKQVLPGKFPFPEGFDEYDPKVAREDIDEQGGELVHIKEIEQIALPERPANLTIQPTVSYFDPDSIRYIRLSANSVPVTIRQGTNKPRKRTEQNDTSVSSKELLPIKTETNFSKIGSRFFLSPLFWLLFLLPIAVFGFVFYKKRKEDRADKTDPLERKKIRARKVAEQRLAQAKKHMDSNVPKLFYDEISDATFGYVCDKLNISLSELTKANVSGKLADAKIPSDLIERFLQIIKTCEMALFAGKDNAAGMLETYEATGSVLAEMEDVFSHNKES